MSTMYSRFCVVSFLQYAFICAERPLGLLCFYPNEVQARNPSNVTIIGISMDSWVVFFSEQSNSHEGHTALTHALSHDIHIKITPINFRQLTGHLARTGWLNHCLYLAHIEHVEL